MNFGKKPAQCFGSFDRTVPFKQTSLKSRERKRKLAASGKKAGGLGKYALLFLVGSLFVLPKFVAMAFRKQRYPLGAKVARLFLGLSFVGAALAMLFVWTDIGNRTGKAFVKESLFALGAELPQDDKGLTNILLLGIGGEAHAQKGHKLTDSMMVASFDASGRSAVMLSIPRDFWVQTPYVRGRINEIVRDESAVFLQELRAEPQNAEMLKNLKGQERLEFIWQLEAQADRRAEKDLKIELEKILDIDIHRIARIDFAGFEKAVDAIGGIDVVVERTINDPTYPDFRWGYDPFYLPEGPHHLDGSTALKYARSRHDSSDFDRAKRQQAVIGAIKDRLTSLQVLTSPTKLRQLYGVIQENFISDLTWDEIISLGELGSKMPRERIVSFVLNNDPTAPGGFLVTPDRALYGGAYVLVPYLNTQADKFAQIRAFAKMIFEHRGLTIFDPPPITVLNGTKQTGLASSLQIHLERYGWKVSGVDNLEEPETTTRIRMTDNPKHRAAAAILQNFFKTGIETVPLASPPAAEPGASPTAPRERFEIILGADYEPPFRTPAFSPQNGQPSPSPPAFRDQL